VLPQPRLRVEEIDDREANRDCSGAPRYQIKCAKPPRNLFRIILGAVANVREKAHEHPLFVQSDADILFRATPTFQQQPRARAGWLPMVAIGGSYGQRDFATIVAPRDELLE
jgi:hypothetical protein